MKITFFLPLLSVVFMAAAVVGLQAGETVVPSENLSFEEIDRGLGKEAEANARFQKIRSGVDPMAERGDLGTFETGRFQDVGYTGKKLAYQLRSTSWSSPLFLSSLGLPEEALTLAGFFNT